MKILYKGYPSTGEIYEKAAPEFKNLAYVWADP